MANPGRSGFRDYAEVLRVRATEAPESLAFRYIHRRPGDPADDLTYGALDGMAAGIAAELRTICNPGARVLILLTPGFDFIGALFACWYAGVIPVPALPPEGPGAKRALPRLRAILVDADCRAIITTASIQQRLNELDAAGLTDIAWLLVEHCKPASPVCGYELSCVERPALIQYTSGSTGTPKGVVLTHANLLANAEHIRQAFGVERTTCGVGWLPPQHDMGLVGSVLQPTFVGCHVVLMSPMTFLQHPLRWLQTITRYRGTTSGGPDFAFRMCVERISDADKAGLDLSSWSLAFTGSEPVRASTLEAFYNAFKDVGFRREAFYPCYGLAEATLMVTGPTRLTGPRVLHANRSALGKGSFQQGDPTGSDTVTVTSCGAVLATQEVIVVVPGTLDVAAEGQVGEVFCRGPNVAQGYWNDPKTTSAAFDIAIPGHGSGFLRTGDLGFLQDRELFITGRSKDLIIVRGKNHFPGDMEATLEDAFLADNLECGAICVFSDQFDAERISVCVELRGTTQRIESQAAKVAELCRRVLAEQHGVAPNKLIVLRMGAIPKTTSGKLQRGATRSALATGELSAIKEFVFTDGSTHTWPTAPTAIGHSHSDVVDWLIEYAAAKKGVPRSAIDRSTPFASFGLDSVEAVTLAAKLGERIHRPIPPTALWEHQTIDALASFAVGPNQEPCLADQVQASSSAVTTEDIAIIGMACRLPGASNVKDFWSLLVDGRREIAKAPPERPGAHALNASGLLAGYLQNVNLFDAAHFQVGTDEACAMDPQQRLLLEVTWELLESAGVNPHQIRGTSAGVFVGISNVDYTHLLAHQASTGVYVGTGNAHSIAANRISYTFDLVGPSIAIDTACSSSLVAVHLACRALRDGECQTAIAAGVNLILTPGLSKIFESSGMLSLTSQCRPFEQSANGYVRGEGCAAILLKPARNAVADGDRIFAVIRGSATNQDGKSNGLTAPNANSQRACIAQALRQARVSGSEIGFVEAHGTGTPLGDPIEFRALRSVLARDHRTPPCYLGAVKANVGHLESAAGIVGLIKCALVLHKGQIPPQPDLGQLNGLLGQSNEILIPSKLIEPAERPTHAGVSSFGFGGTNAHVILGCAPGTPVDGAPGALRPTFAVHLSARVPHALEQLAARYRKAIEEGGESAALAITCVTLGRRARQDQRAFVVSDSLNELVSGLQAVERGATQSCVLGLEFRQPLCWICGELEVSEELVQRWNEAIPGFASRFTQQLNACGSDATDPRARVFSFHRAMTDALAEWGLTPAVMTGTDVGLAAAAAWTCDLSIQQSGTLFRYVRGIGALAPTPLPTAPGRRLILPDGTEQDQVDVQTLCKNLGATSANSSTQFTTVLWGNESIAASASTFAPLAWHSKPEALARCLAIAELSGSNVDWHRYLAVHGEGYTRMPSIDVPSYPFEQVHYWHDMNENGSGPRTYSLTWQPEPLTELERKSPGTWLVAGNGTELTVQIETELASRGGQAIVVSDLSNLNAALHTINRPRGILLLLENLDAERLQCTLMQILDAWRALEGCGAPLVGGLRIVTRGAYQVSGERVNPLATALWGFVRTLVNESLDGRVQAIDIGVEPGLFEPQTLLRELDASAFEHVLLRGNNRFVGRLVLGNAGARPARFDGGAVVISGGFGSLGVAVADWFSTHGASHLILLGRDSTRNSKRVESIRSRGVPVTTFAVDVANRESLREVFAKLDRDGVTVRGVVHAAGLLRDGLLESQSLETFVPVITSKVISAIQLREATVGMDLAFFCLVSSVAGVLGAPGQGAYSAANCYLDGFAEQLRQQGVAAVAVALGPVQNTNMTLEGGRAPMGAGIVPMSSTDAVEAIASSCCNRQSAWQAVVGFREESALSNVATQQIRKLLDGTGQAKSTHQAQSLLQQLDCAVPRREVLLVRWLMERVAEVTHRPSDSIPREQGFLELGLDSMNLLQLRGRLQEELAIRIEPAMMFEYPTIERLARYLASEVLGTTTSPTCATSGVTQHANGETSTIGYSSAPTLAYSGGDFLATLEQMDDHKAERLVEELPR